MRNWSTQLFNLLGKLPKPAKAIIAYILMKSATRSFLLGARKLELANRLYPVPSLNIHVEIITTPPHAATENGGRGEETRLH